jgi:hypothetical protein
LRLTVKVTGSVTPAEAGAGHDDFCAAIARASPSWPDLIGPSTPCFAFDGESDRVRHPGLRRGDGPGHDDFYAAIARASASSPGLTGRSTPYPKVREKTGGFV